MNFDESKPLISRVESDVSLDNVEDCASVQAATKVARFQTSLDNVDDCASVQAATNVARTQTLEPGIIIENELIETETSLSEPGPEPEEIDIQMQLLHTKENRDLNEAYPLPDGKDAHFFVSYSSEDRARVLPIVLKLEKKHRVACIIDDRDFTHGMDIALNINKGMERSTKVLLFLSQNFIKSNYCIHEQNLAFVMSMESGESKIIPVLLEKCRVPSTLKTLTYLDVNAGDVDERIMTAYNRTDTDILPADFDFVAPKKLENGYFYDIGCVVEKTWLCCRPARKHLNFDDATLQALLDAKLQVSDEMLCKALAIVDSGYSASQWSKLDPGVLVCLCVCCWPVALLGFIFLVNVLYLSVFDRSRETEEQHPDLNFSDLFMALLFIMTLGAPTFLLCLCITSKLWKKKGLAKLQRTLHTEVTRHTYKTGVLFDIYIQPARILKCVRETVVKYLTNKIAEKLEEKADLTVGIEMMKPEDIAEGMIWRQLRELGTNLTILPDAPVNRHNVKGGKACFCQMLEGKILTEFLRNKQPRIDREEKLGKRLVQTEGRSSSIQTYSDGGAEIV